MEDEETTSGAAAVIDAVERLSEAEEIVLAGPLTQKREPDLLVVPDGKKVIDLRPFQDARLDNPRRRKGTSTHTTLASFIDHALRHRDDHSVIFVKDTSPPSLTTIYDYNEPPKSDGRPRFGEHRSVYAMPLSDEWKAWEALAKADWMGQEVFAARLEDRVIDILSPGDVPSGTQVEANALGMTLAGPSTLLALSRGLTVKADVAIANHVNLNTGEAQINFAETHDARDAAGTSIKVPSGFAVSIPVFVDGSRYALLARIRYRMSGAKVLWKLSLHRADNAMRDATNDAAKAAGKDTKLPLFFGTPET